MKESDLSEFEIEQEGLKLRICRSGTTAISPIAATATPQITVNTDSSNSTELIAEETGIQLIKSPMVGTFYQASSPESPPYTKVGDTVEPTTVVCIIEAMKVMNEIHAEAQGKVVEVLIKNGATVEYGQPLFKIKV